MSSMASALNADASLTEFGSVIAESTRLAFYQAILPDDANQRPRIIFANDFLPAPTGPRQRYRAGLAESQAVSTSGNVIAAARLADNRAISIVIEFSAAGLTAAGSGIMRWNDGRHSMQRRPCREPRSPLHWRSGQHGPSQELAVGGVAELSPAMTWLSCRG